MKHIEAVAKNKTLFLALVFYLFCFSSVSFSEETGCIISEGEGIAPDRPHHGYVLEQSEREKSILLRLGNTPFDPLKGFPGQGKGIKQIQPYEQQAPGYYIVQFNGPIKKGWKDALVSAGAEILDYIPDFAFIIRLIPDNKQVVRELPNVRWLGIYKPLYRINQDYLETMSKKLNGSKEAQGSETCSVLLRAVVFPGEDMARIMSEIAALGGTVMDTISAGQKTILKIEIPMDRVPDVASIHGIKWVEQWPVRKLHNDKSTDINGIRTPRDTKGLYGEGQTVAVCDTGLDQGSADPAYLHDDFEDGAGGSRVSRIFDRVGDGADDVNSGHGTHVAGSILGNGHKSGSDSSSDNFPSTCFAGMAPRASLVFQAVEDNITKSLSGIPSDLKLLFSEARGAGASLHSNSWGNEAVYGQYDSDSRAVDEYVWENKDFLILFSAGNDGVDADGDGVVDLFSLISPGTAKNCLTVGASEGNRPSFSQTWGGSWPEDYPADPIFSDRMADYPGGIVAFSSRGPCFDGRYKPDIVAPGTFILSTRSSVASGTGWGVYNTYYMYNGGTSMATPLAAGTAALMREYLIKKKGIAQPSSALIKAALINSAEDISPGQYGTGAFQEIPDSPVPNNVEGWGRLNLGRGVYPQFPFNILYYDEQNSLNTGAYREYSIDVTNSGYPLKINLVWTDYPGSPAVNGGLVNDLDLEVRGPYSAVHYPDGVCGKLFYDNNSLQWCWYQNIQAMQFSPSSYPCTVKSAAFCFYNPGYTDADVGIVVYDDKGAGGLPGNELFRKKLAHVATGWNTTQIKGVTLTGGNFYIAVEKLDPEQGIIVDDGNPAERGFFYDGSGWVQSPYTSYIRAEVCYFNEFDRMNNVVGLTLDSPDTGTYTVKVIGYNVPFGPQPYALVISGAVNRASLYYPHIASIGVWETEICVINTSDSQTINGLFKAYSDAGELVTETEDVTLPPHGRREITVGDEFTDPAGIGYIIFESDSDNVIGYTKFYTAGKYRVAIPAVSEINTGDIYITHIASNSVTGWGTGISLLNTTSSTKSLTIEFDNGQTKALELAANEHEVFLIRDLFEGEYQPGIHSAVVKDASGVIGLELFTNSPGNQMSGILLKGDTTTRIYYPHTASEGGWGTGIVAYNPSETDCDITITPYTGSGYPLTPATDTIGGKQQYIGLVSALGLPAETAWVMIEAESAITGFELFARTNLLAGYTGVGITGKEGIFVKLEKDGATGIAFVNIEDNPAAVNLTAYNDSGVVVATRTIYLNAHEKTVGTPDSIFTGDISSATYIGYSSDRELAAFQLNASSDGMMLDALPGL